MVDKEKKAKYMKQFRKKNKEALKIKKAKYYQKNKQKIKENMKEYYQQNKEEITEKHNQYLQTHKKEQKARDSIKIVIEGSTEPFIMEDCAFCGKKATIKHHENYDLPLFIYFLCQSCHMSYHKNGKVLNIKQYITSYGHHTCMLEG